MIIDEMFHIPYFWFKKKDRGYSLEPPRWSEIRNLMYTPLIHTFSYTEIEVFQMYKIQGLVNMMTYTYDNLNFRVL